MRGIRTHRPSVLSRGMRPAPREIENTKGIGHVVSRSLWLNVLRASRIVVRARIVKLLPRAGCCDASGTPDRAPHTVFQSIVQDRTSKDFSRVSAESTENPRQFPLTPMTPREILNASNSRINRSRRAWAAGWRTRDGGANRLVRRLAPEQRAGDAEAHVHQRKAGEIAQPGSG